MLWAERIPNPNPEDILKSAIGYETEGYLHQLYYHYPRRGGYQAISEAWAKRVPVTYGFRVKSLERRGESWLVSDGAQTREYRRIVSTLPIQHLAKHFRGIASLYVKSNGHHRQRIGTTKTQAR